MTTTRSTHYSATGDARSRWAGALVLALAGVAFVGWRTWSYMPSVLPAGLGPPPAMIPPSRAGAGQNSLPAGPPAGGPLMIFQQLDLTTDQKARFEELRDQRLPPPEMMRAVGDILTPVQRDKMAHHAAQRVDRDLDKVLPEGEREKLKAKIEQRVRSGHMPPPPMTLLIPSLAPLLPWLGSAAPADDARERVVEEGALMARIGQGDDEALAAVATRHHEGTFRQMTQRLRAVARELTPEQRAHLLELMHERRGRLLGQPPGPPPPGNFGVSPRASVRCP